MTIQFHDSIGLDPTNILGTLAVQYDPTETTITLVNPLPAYIQAKGGTLDGKLDSQLFVVEVGSGTTLNVTLDSQTADAVHVVGTPLILELSASRLEELRDTAFAAADLFMAQNFR